MSNKIYRNNGAIGALLDEYERAVQDLNDVLKTVSSSELVSIVDDKTTDADCRSIQTILTHVVRSGYGYVTYIRRHIGESLDFPERILLNSIADYRDALDKMFAYNIQLFADYPHVALEVFDSDKKILVNWGQLYDIEQLMEHAIVHILRHRRQIERFIIKLKM
jgi:hypothetical protein